MLRKKAVALALSMLIPTVASALGLGALKARSGLNQPFEGSIEILGATATDFDSLSIRLASPEAFERAGVQRDAVLLSLKFDVVETPAGNDYIRISTRDPVREPFLNFLLELNWANGRMVREYTVLLDPPLYDPNRRAAAPAYTPAPAAARPAATPAPTSAPAPTATSPVAAPPAAPVAADGTLGTVQATDTAWALAMRHRPDSSVSVQRMMVALLRANPEAFANDNINQLRRGAVLRMPAQADIDGLSQAEAVAEVARQHQLWEEYRQGVSTATPAQPMSETPASPAPETDDLDAALAAPDEAAESKADDARLELVAPEAGSDEAGTPGAGAADDTEATADEDATALAAEGETTTAAAEAELKSKLDEASEIIDLLQRQVEIKDEELARLQARLAELGVETPAAAPTPAPATADEAAEPGSPATPPAADTAPTAEAEPPASETPAPPVADAEVEPAAPAPPPPPPVADTKPEPAKPVAKPKPVAPPPPAAASGLDALIPASLRDAVPGGSTTIVGVLGSLLLLLLAVLGKSLAGRRGKEIKSGPKPAAPAVVVAAPAAVAGATAATTLDDLDEPVVSSAPAIGADGADQFTRTLEATAEQLQGDPLEEVNVYLAYERFDQAEELVKKVIAQYPNEHKYKLRLLEIYYSANNKQAYETHARELLDAVGEHNPLWENAVAMWTEMSPHRALFEAGPLDATAHDAGGAANEFVDVTGENTSPGGATMTMGPGEDGPLAVTAVGLTNDYTSNESVLDFDLTSSVGDADLEPMLDLTTGEPGDGAGMIDLTATVEQLEKSGFLDLTGGMPLTEERATEGDAIAFDVSGAAEEAALDFDTGGGDELAVMADTSETADFSLDATVQPEAETADLLDITKTGNVAGNLDLDADEPLLSVTAGSLADTASGAGVSSAPPADEELNLDFDISDTVAPKIETGEGPDLERAEDVDVTAKLPAEEPLDFDIDSLGLDLDIDAPSTAASAPLAGDDQFDLTVEGEDFSLDLDAEAGADLDLSLQSPNLDFNIADGLSATHGGSGGVDDSDLEFDLALQDTTDFSKLDVDDTLELPKSSTARPAVAPLAESLEDLTRSMEASLAGLDLDEEPADDGMLDLDLGQIGASEDIELDFSLDDIQPESSHDTLALDHEDLSLERTGMHTDKTVVMPRDENVEYQSESDEVDTKLNLAKAYIELGDSEGARTILDEVTREGTDGQQQEARQLLSQLS